MTPNGKPRDHALHGDSSNGCNTLCRPSTLQQTRLLIDFQINLDPLKPTMSYQVSHLRASHCRPIVAFHRIYPALRATSTALRLSNTLANSLKTF
ncbi:hypothetical protein TNCV_3470541 [Trichonephila clavipes]|nr:hypothetical protein TNCV_3470541 [Trichonephila clavipes]